MSLNNVISFFFFLTFPEDWGLQEQCDILFLELSTSFELQQV